jgi:hypothetical protein
LSSTRDAAAAILLWIALVADAVFVVVLLKRIGEDGAVVVGAEPPHFDHPPDETA